MEVVILFNLTKLFPHFICIGQKFLIIKLNVRAKKFDLFIFDYVTRLSYKKRPFFGAFRGQIIINPFNAKHILSERPQVLGIYVQKS